MNRGTLRYRRYRRLRYRRNEGSLQNLHNKGSALIPKPRGNFELAAGAGLLDGHNEALHTTRAVTVTVTSMEILELT
jgi:hypothetical protein